MKSESELNRPLIFQLESELELESTQPCPESESIDSSPIPALICHDIYYIRSKVHKRFSVTNALLAQPLGLKGSCMARFEGLEAGVSQNSEKFRISQCVAMET